MLTFHKSESPQIYPFLILSFPDLSQRQYQKINHGKHFNSWEWAEKDGEIVACAAIFRRDRGYKMGLFCTHPGKRRTGIGKIFYRYLTSIYNPLEWTALSEESVCFYKAMGSKDLGIFRGMDGRYYVSFQS